MSEFEQKLIEHLINIEKQNQQIIDILSKSVDLALGSDSLNTDEFKDLFGIK